MKQWQFTYSYLGPLCPTLQRAAARASLRHPSNNFVLEPVSKIVAVSLLMVIAAAVYALIAMQQTFQGKPGDFDVEGLAGGRPGWETRFIPALCPACGWDMA